MLREALSSGVYAGQFTGPHRSPLYPHSGKVKPTPTRRPVVLSQEYIDNLNAHLIGAGIYRVHNKCLSADVQLFIVLGVLTGFPGLNGLYNILTHVPNNLYKRTANSSDFFGDYAPYAPKQAAEYRTDMDEVVETAMHGPLNYKDKFAINKFVPIEVLLIPISKIYKGNLNEMLKWIGTIRQIRSARLCQPSRTFDQN
jgi:hypothetical protein